MSCRCVFLPVTRAENRQITLNCFNYVAAEERTSLLKADVTQRHLIQEIMSVNLSKIQSLDEKQPIHVCIFLFIFEGLRPS